MSRRTWITLGLCGLGLLLPAAAQAATARVRVLNAAPSGAVTFKVDGVAKATGLAPSRESARFNVRPGRHTFAAVRGTRTVARRSVVVSSGERVTIAYAVNRGKPELRLLREPPASAGATQLRVANLASAAGAVDVRADAAVLARAVAYGATTAAFRIPAGSSTGLASITARTRTNAVAAATLVLATRSTGLFVLVPRGGGVRLLRLAYEVAPPTPTRQPAVTGTRRFGNEVRCERDAWTPKGVTVRRQWSVDGVAAGSSPALALTTAAHAGRTIGCTVTATFRGMTTTVRTSFALPSAPKMLTPPFVEFPGGTLLPGDLLTCNPGTWTPSSLDFTVRWIRIGSGVQIGTGPTYALGVPADNGMVNSLGCDVVAATDGGAAARVRSINYVALGVAPTVAIIPNTKPADGTEETDAFFQWTIGGGGAATIECSIDLGPFSERECIGTNARTYHFPAPGANGAHHVFSVRVTNPVDTAADTYAWTIVPPAPTIALVDPQPTTPTTATTATFNWTRGGGPAALTCELDGSEVACSGTGVSVSVPPPGVQGDTHTFTVSASNAKPATASDSHTWVVRPADPAVSNLDLDPIDGSISAPFVLTFAVTGQTTSVKCQVDALPVIEPCTSPQSFPDPGAGPHTVVVTAANPFGVGAAHVDWTYIPADDEPVPPPESDGPGTVVRDRTRALAYGAAARLPGSM